MRSKEIPPLIRGVLRKIIKYYAPQKVILFGSFAHGNPRPGSDIDLLIIKDTQERPIDRWVKVRRILSDTRRRRTLEIIVLTPKELSEREAIGDQIVAKLVKEGKVLYGK